MITSSAVIDVEELHAGSAVEVTLHAKGNRKYEKRFKGIVINSTPLEVKIDYYDPKEMSTNHHNSRRLIRRVFSLDEIKEGNISLRTLI